MIGPGVRFPRSMVANPASERLLRFLGVSIVDECDPDLERAARDWLANVDVGDRDAPSTKAVREALERTDARRAA